MIKLANQSLPRLAFLCLHDLSETHKITDIIIMMMMMKAALMVEIVTVVETAAVHKETILNLHT